MEPSSSLSNFSEAVYSHLPCFFCNGLTDNSESSNVKLQSLGNLFNYLRLCPPNVTGNNNNVEMEMSSILSICKRCSQMAEEFNEIHHVLEVTKKLLNRCLGRVLEVMAKPEHDAPNDNEEEDADGDGDLRSAMMGRIKEVRSPTQIVMPSAIKDSNGQSRTTNSNVQKMLPSTHLDTEDKIELKGNKSDADVGIGGDGDQVRNFATMKKRHKKTRRRLFSITDSNDIAASSPYPSSSSKTNEKKSFANIYHSMRPSDTTDERIKIPGKKRSKNKNRNIKARICKFCKKTFATAFIARRHMKYNCSKNKDRQPPPPPPADTGSGSGSLLTCAYCSYECANHHFNMKPHLIRQHPEMFFQSERNNASTSPWKYENFKRIVKEIAFPKFFSRNGSSAACSCSLCGKIYDTDKKFLINYYQIMKHLINEHLQEIREYVKDVMEQSDAYLKEQLDYANVSPLRRSQKSESNLCDEGNENGNDMPVSLLYGFSMWDTLMDGDADGDESCSVLPNDVEPSSSCSWAKNNCDMK